MMGWVAAIMMAVAVALGAHAISSLQVARIAMEGPGVDVSRIPSLWFRLAFPLLDRMAPIMAGIRWPSYRRQAGMALQRAGFDAISVDHLLAMKVFMAVFLPAFMSLIITALRNPGIFVLAVIGAFYLPDYLVSEVRKVRERKIVRALPGAVDVLLLLVEAGLDFLAAIHRLVEQASSGPIRDEMATVLNDVRLGTSRAQALKNMAARVPVPEVTSFVSVLVQADMLGSSIGPVLQTQSERMRVERFQRAEKEGAKATQKILFPLVFFIFPAVLIIIIGPVVLQYLASK
jgi:tight adherence protein C